jgi:hypothetical protein
MPKLNSNKKFKMLVQELNLDKKTQDVATKTNLRLEIQNDATRTDMIKFQDVVEVDDVPTSSVTETSIVVGTNMGFRFEVSGDGTILHIIKDMLECCMDIVNFNWSHFNDFNTKN